MKSDGHAEKTMADDLHIVVNKHTPYAVEAFERLGRVTALDTPEITADKVKDADILIVRSETKVNQSLLDGSRVKFVGTVTIGTDHVDERYLAEKGIKFVSAAGSNSNSVSEYITAVMLELADKKGFALDGKSIGIIGVGNVGSKVWRKLEALGMKVLLNDPPLQRLGSSYPLLPLENLMDTDIITLHVPLTRSGPDATYHFFDENMLRKMKKGAILINSSRGAVVETEALKRVLKEGHISSAVLDVWEKEPAIDASLLELVTLGTQHIAGHSLDGKLNALRMNYEAVCRFLSRPADLEIDISLLDPVKREIRVNETEGSIHHNLRDIVKQCYDVNEDDRLLRRIFTIPQEERGRFFSGLRTGYRVRREFFNYTVHGNGAPKELITLLQLLGFKTSGKI
ncbi:MAG: 4-phosphoerythronate dehydrogenase [Bacteroidetes bacterium]|nr:4-phosphoerythronate dehydrogenase [Bacteroidota bacterium]